MRTIAGLFGKSPFGALQAHISKVNKCVRLLRPLFEAVIGGEEKRVAGFIDEISSKEHEADKIKNELRDRLPRSLFLPAARSDLLVLLEVQDAIADAAEDVAILLRIRKPAIPPSYGDDLLKLVDYAQSSCDGLLAIFERLADLLEGSFRGKPAADVADVIRKVGETEHEADKQGLLLMTRVFNLEGELSTPDLIIWDKLICNLSRVSDLSEKAANRVRILLAR